MSNMVDLSCFPLIKFVYICFWASEQTFFLLIALIEENVYTDKIDTVGF